MGFDVGSIVAKLQLDKTGWNQSIGGITKDQQTLTDAAKKIGQGFTDAGRSMAIAGAAITGTLGTMIYKTAEYGDHLVELSQKTGISVETLSGLKLAADKVGLSLDGLALGLKAMSVNMVEAATGAGDGAKLFKALGISVVDSSGKMRDTSAVMLDVADRFKGMENGAVKTNLAVKLFGRAGMELIPILNLGSEGLREQRDLAEKLGITFTKEGAEGAHEFSHSLIDLRASAEGMGKQIATSLLPTVNILVKGVTDIIVKVREWAAAHPGLSQAISTSALALGGMLTGMGSFLMIAGTLITKLLTISSALNTTAASLLGSISIWSAAVVAVGYYIAKLFELKAAIDYADEADKRFVKGNIDLSNKLYGLVTSGKMAIDTYYKLWDQFNGNAAAMAMFIEKGNAGKVAQEGLVAIGKEHAKVVDEQRKKTGDLNASILALLAGGADGFSKWLTGLVPDMAEVSNQLRIIDSLFAAGKISPVQYAAAMKDLTDKFDKLGVSINRILPPARDMSKAWDEMKPKIGGLPPVLEDVGYGFDDAKSALLYWSRELDVGTDKIATAIIAWQNLQFTLLGFGPIIAGIDFASLIGKENNLRTATGNMRDSWASIWRDMVKSAGKALADIGVALVEATGIFNFLKTAAKTFDETPYTKEQAAIKQTYQDKKTALDKTTQDTINNLDTQQSAEEAAIQNSGRSEADKAAMIQALDIKYQIAREAAQNEAAAKKQALDEQEVIDNQAALDKENAARDKFAADEERRQNSLWTKVKNIVGTAADDMLKVLMSRCFDKLVDSILGIGKTASDVLSKAAKDTASAVGGISQGAVGAMSGMWTALGSAVGSFLGTLLGNILSGGPSGHQQQQQINDTKDSRNFLADIKNWMFSAGSGFGGAIWDFLAKFEMEKFDGLKGSVDLSRDSLNPKVDEANRWLKDISGWGFDISGKLGNLPSAQHGGMSTATSLIVAHGTPSAPEYILPERTLANIASAPRGEAGGSKVRDVTVNIHLDGQIITDREYTRSRIIPEIIEAARSGLKSQLQAALGVA